MEQKILHTTHVIEVNSGGILANNYEMMANMELFKHSAQILAWLYDEARTAEHALHENRQALVLYCQQFAFAPEMVDPCHDLLKCVDSELPYKVSDSHFDVHPHSH